MNKKFEKIIERIAIIKMNIFFIIIFGGGMMYSAEMLRNADSLKEIFFWTSIILIITLQIFPSVSRIMDKVQEFIVNKKKFAKNKLDEVENEKS